MSRYNHHTRRQRHPCGACHGKGYLDRPALYRAFGQRVRARREALGLLQREVAKDCGISRTMLTTIEAGAQRVKYHDVIALAAALRCRVAELVPW